MIRLTKQALLLIASVLLANIGMCGPYPRGCEVTGFWFAGNDLVLNEAGSQRLYMIQNRSKKPVELERVDTDENTMYPMLESKLDPMNWSAFASNETQLHFKCYIHSGENAKDILDCTEILDVCEYPRVKFALSNMGTYWISTNKKQDQVIKDTAAKGIYLRW